MSGDTADTTTTGKLNIKLVVALVVTGGTAIWGIADTQGLADLAQRVVGFYFTSRGWFVMLTVSALLIAAIALALSPYGTIVLGRDDDKPEFSTPGWLSMLFAAGMGVGLLYWGSAEPITHYLLGIEYMDKGLAASRALFITNFHWGLHAWAIYAILGLIIAYFSFRRGYPMLLSKPIEVVFGHRRWTAAAGWLCDVLAIVAIAIGLGGSVAMGVFQVQSGIESILGMEPAGLALALPVFAVLCAVYVLPLLVPLDRGMSLMSETAMLIAGGLMIFVLLAGPTHYIMNAIVEQIGAYFGGVLQHGFETYTFFDERIGGWFQSWTLTYMVWWLAWAPFVGVFVARISRGRTIREFVIGVILAPTGFSMAWFGTFGAAGFYDILLRPTGILAVTEKDPAYTSFFLLQNLPLSTLTSIATIVAAFLFIVTSVVSAAFVLGMFSSGGDLNPSRKVKLAWGVVLGALGLVMILSGSIDAVKSIIALGAIPFVFIVLLLLVCFLKALKAERPK
ncbi:BCCT family transporter [Nisaea acidiphila]|uniref:BCCT family transporter n=1 Tax=Nisaea acidiphila TaxID=1862145 RepID=A0A9J7AW48_9PROT|nr:BCCT family transporter [Nisaea acidiphila]UUX50673.1 BCCT family transporter [Nisaea acidiphila]